MSSEDHHAVARYTSIADSNPLSRRLDLMRRGIVLDGYLKNARLFDLI